MYRTILANVTLTNGKNNDSNTDDIQGCLDVHQTLYWRNIQAIMEGFYKGSPLRNRMFCTIMEEIM